MSRFTIVICALLVAAGAHRSAAQATESGLKLRMLGGHPVVDGVYVNGHGPYRFLVDTGATLNHLEATLGRSIGLVPAFRTEMVSAAGVTIATGSDGANVALGAAYADDQTFLFAGLEAVHQLSPDIQGVLGQAFLSRFDYRLDVGAGRLAFGTRETAGARVPLRTIHGRSAVWTSLGWLILDSGAQRLILFGVTTSNVSQQIATVSGPRLVGTVPRKLLIGGRVVWSGDAVGLPEALEEGVAGLLPMSLFRVVYVCNSGSYVVLT